MKKSNFEEKINRAFKAETPDVLDKIKSSNQFFVPEKKRKYDFKALFNKRLSYSLASMFVLAIVLFSIMSSGNRFDSVVASTITIDINPSIEITLNENDEVINIKAINSDAETLLDHDVKFRGLSLDRAIEILMEKAVEKGYIIDSTEDNIILIDVSSKQAIVRERVEEQLQKRIREEMEKAAKNVQIRLENRQDLSDNQKNDLEKKAIQYRVSVAKLYIINKIIIEDSTYSINTLRDKSVRELYDILTSLTNSEDSNISGPGNN